MDGYQQNIMVRWSDLDPNGHVRHSAYYDYGAQLRIACFQQAGVGIAWLAGQGIGPVLFREEAKFYRELRLDDDLLIDLRLTGLSEDQRKWSMRHQILRDGEELCATIDLDGAWLNLQVRRIVPPPERLRTALAAMPRTEDFRIIA
jgi:acyl-CoA thioester hydrolase